MQQKEPSLSDGDATATAKKALPGELQGTLEEAPAEPLPRLPVRLVGADARLGRLHVLALRNPERRREIDGPAAAMAAAEEEEEEGKAMRVENDLNEVPLVEPVEEVEEYVLVVLRVTLDTHDVLPAPEHFHSRLLRPGDHLRPRRQLPDLRPLKFRETDRQTDRKTQRERLRVGEGGVLDHSFRAEPRRGGTGSPAAAPGS